MALGRGGERAEVVQTKAGNSTVRGEGSSSDLGSPRSRWTRRRADGERASTGGGSPIFKLGTLASLYLTVTPPSVIVVHMCDTPSKALYSSDKVSSFPSLGLVTGPSHLVYTSQ